MEEYKDTLPEIEQDLQKSKAPSDNERIDQNHFEYVERQTSEYGLQYDNRDKLYTRLLDHYITTTETKNERNRAYKAIFFWFTMIAFALLIIFPFASIIVIAFTDPTDVTAIATIASGVISAISAVIILPKIIAVHLFPTDEDKNMIDLVKNMQSNDSGIRKNSQTMRNVQQKAKEKNK